MLTNGVLAEDYDNNRQVGGPVAVALCDESYAELSHANVRLFDRGTGPRLQRQANGWTRIRRVRAPLILP